MARKLRLKNEALRQRPYDFRGIMAFRDKMAISRAIRHEQDGRKSTACATSLLRTSDAMRRGFTAMRHQHTHSEVPRNASSPSHDDAEAPMRTCRRERARRGRRLRGSASAARPYFGGWPAPSSPRGGLPPRPSRQVIARARQIIYGAFLGGSKHFSSPHMPYNALVEHDGPLMPMMSVPHGNECLDDDDDIYILSRQNCERIDASMPQVWH